MWNPYEPLRPGWVRYALGAGAYVLVLVVWSILALLEVLPGNTLPAPWEVVGGFLDLAAYNEARQSHILFDATLASVSRIAISTVVTLLIGLPLGILMGSSNWLNGVLGPLLDPFRSAPIVAILPILVMWLGIGETLKVAFLVMGAIVYLIPMVRDAMNQPSEVYITMKDLGASDWEAIRHGLLPMALPRIWDAMTVAVSIQWTYITVAEYVNAKSGLGTMIQNSKRFSAMDQVFAGILVIIGLALVTNVLLVFLKKRLFPWETE